MDFEEMFVRRILEDEEQHIESQRSLFSETFREVFGFKPEITDYRKDNRFHKFGVGGFWLYVYHDGTQRQLYSEYGPIPRPASLAKHLERAHREHYDV